VFVNLRRADHRSQTEMSDKPTKQSRSRNALVHGLHAKDVLLPWDCKEDFEKLHQDLKAEFSPRGRAEDEAVLDLADLHWQKRTLWRMRQVAVLKDPFTKDIIQTRRKSWSGIRKRLRWAAHDQRTLLGTVEAEHAEMVSEVRRLQKELDTASDREAVKVTEEKLNALHRTIAEHVVPLLQRLMQVPDAEQAFDAAYATESMEKMVRLEAALDARVAKVLARLVGLKEFKRTPAGGAPPMALSSRTVT
jgi:hypothetical protein